MILLQKKTIKHMVLCVILLFMMAGCGKKPIRLDTPETIGNEKVLSQRSYPARETIPPYQADL